MLQLTNRTPFDAAIVVLPDVTGVDTVYTIVKATFTFGTGVAVADEQLPVALIDSHYGDPGASSVRVASDANLGKVGTDVLLVGSAWAPGGRPAWAADVGVRVGPVTKAARVYGDRVWDAGRAGAVPAWVAPFERMPLVWERAFGGTDLTENGPVADARNPVGVGFRAPGSTTPVHGSRLPNLEDPSAPIASPRDKPPPACFAPVAPHWEPRRTYAGTYDENWQSRRAPYLPEDFDRRFFQVGPVGMTVAGRLRGGELVEAFGVAPHGPIRFVLPSLVVHATYRVGRAEHRHAAALDTVLIEPDASRLVMVWTAARACDKAVLKVKEVETAVQAAA